MTFEEYVLVRGPALIRLARLLVDDAPYEELDPSGNTQHYTTHLRIPNPYLEVWTQGAYGLSEALLVAGGLELSSR